MERSGLPLSSMNPLGSFLLFVIHMMTLLTRAFSVSLPLPKVGMLGCVAMDDALPYQTALGG
jgi:hypothetical protein